jgi:hypothetical protein
MLGFYGCKISDLWQRGKRIALFNKNVWKRFLLPISHLQPLFAIDIKMGAKGSGKL